MTEAKRTNSKGERFRQCVSGGRDVQRENVLHSGSQRAGRTGPLLTLWAPWPEAGGPWGFPALLGWVTRSSSPHQAQSCPEPDDVRGI